MKVYTKFEVQILYTLS